VVPWNSLFASDRSDKLPKILTKISVLQDCITRHFTSESLETMSPFTNIHKAPLKTIIPFVLEINTGDVGGYLRVQWEVNICCDYC